MTQNDASLRQGQMIIAALAMGVSTFLVITFFVPWIGPPEGESSDLFVPLMGALGLMIPSCVVMGLVVSRKMLAPLAESLRSGAEPDAEYPAPMRSADLVRAALTEGPALFGVVTYMLTRHPAALVVPVLGVLLLLAQIPTRARVQNRLNDLRRPNY